MGSENGGGKRKKNKKVPDQQRVALRKEVKQPVFKSHNAEKPSWRFSNIQTTDPYGWHNLTTERLYQLIDRIKHFETMTWNEILIKAKKYNHSVAIWRLEKKARDRLSELRLDDVDELVSLRIDGGGRVWGIRHNAVLLLLWWDPDHQVCLSTLKHT